MRSCARFVLDEIMRVKNATTKLTIGAKMKRKSERSQST